jgi:hypothetical protein
MAMPEYRLKVAGEYITVEAPDLEAALTKAGIDREDLEEPVEDDVSAEAEFQDKCLFSAIADEGFQDF